MRVSHRFQRLQKSLIQTKQKPDAAALSGQSFTKNRMIVVNSRELKSLMKLQERKFKGRVDNLRLSSPKPSTVWIED